MREALANKILILGVDGMDPRLTRKYVDEGKMPNTKLFIDRGAKRDDLVMLGAQPTVTPPMWTTLATGAYPCTHGITGFARQNKEDLDVRDYNLDSTLCQAEQLWNVFAESGKKTLVWHWPGSSWPPSSESPNLHVVDGTQPSGVNNGNATVESEFILVASTKTDVVTFREKAASDANVPCVLTDLGTAPDSIGFFERIHAKSVKNILLDYLDGEAGTSETPFDVVLSPIAPAKGWTCAPEGAKELTILFSGGLIRRVALILPNKSGIYDQVAIYKTKKSTDPIVILDNNVFTKDVIDEALKNDVQYTVNRNMRIIELAEDGNYLKLWVSSAMDISNDTLWHPQKLHKKIIENVGYPVPVALLGGANKKLISDCMGANWTAAADWTANALNYLIESENYDVIFSHFHNVDLQGHMLVKYLKDKGHNKLPESDYQQFMEDIYVQTDDYLGKFVHLLDKGWTILIVSDHAQVCPEHEPPLIGDSTGVNIRVMEELGFTTIKKDAHGHDLKEIDWAKTKAVAVRSNHIYLNIKGRDKHGIVAPEDQYELEEEIMTALYGYRDKQTGKRVIALALRNRESILLGLGGPESGDICFWNAEGYNYDHCDSLSTAWGYAGTSVSPIFIGCGQGFKENFMTKRIIRQVDFAPTVAVLGGVRMPAECEGAPIYQILAKEF